MCKIKYTFHPSSVTGLNRVVTVYSFNFIEAKERVLKWIYLGTTFKHEDNIIHTTGIYVDCDEIGG